MYTYIFYISQKNSEGFGERPSLCVATNEIPLMRRSQCCQSAVWGQHFFGRADALEVGIKMYQSRIRNYMKLWFRLDMTSSWKSSFVLKCQSFANKKRMPLALRTAVFRLKSLRAQPSCDASCLKTTPFYGGRSAATVRNPAPNLGFGEGLKMTVAWILEAFGNHMLFLAGNKSSMI